MRRADTTACWISNSNREHVMKDWIGKHRWLFFGLVTMLTWGVWGELSELIERAGFPSGHVYVVWAFSMVPCAAAALRIARWRLDRSPRALLLGLSAGLLGAGGQLVLFEALRFGPAYIVFPFVSMSPVVTIALSLALLHERASRIQIFGIVVALAAIFFLSWQEGTHDGTAEGGLWPVLAVVVFVAWGVQGYVMKFANASMSAESIFFYMALTGLMLVPVALRMAGPQSGRIGAGLWIGGFLTQLLNAVGALTLVYAYRYGKAIIISPMQGLAPLITMVLSLVIFAVVPGPMLTVGLVLAVVALVLGIPLGAAMARSQSGFWDRFGTAFIVFVNAVPAAVYYIYLQSLGSTALRVSMLFSREDLRTWILPVFSMSLGNIAYYAMWLRRYMVDENNKDYVKLARAKGVNESKITMRHVFRNAFVPMIQYIPTSLMYTVCGSIYIESLYSIPGMGGLLVDVISRQDNPMVQAIVMIYSCIGIVGLILGDLLMVLVDPRISLHGKGDAR